jgi:L-alanine-DL-glutamate epimerase-like enolase superfamily enzyme
VRRVREAFPDVTLMHDAEGRYTREETEAVARACADGDAPLPDLDLEGYRRLRRAVPDVPILPGGDAIWDARLAGDLPRDPPWDAVFDVSFACGPTAARGLMDEAAAAGLDVELISVIQAANLHVPLAFGRTSFFEKAVPPEPFEHGVRRPLRTGQDGLVHAPEGPGLGIELDDETIDDATIAVATAVACTTRKEHCRCGSRDGAQS